MEAPTTSQNSLCINNKTVEPPIISDFSQVNNNSISSASNENVDSNNSMIIEDCTPMNLESE